MIVLYQPNNYMRSILFDAAAAIEGIIDVVKIKPGANDLMKSINISFPVM